MHALLWSTALCIVLHVPLVLADPVRLVDCTEVNLLADACAAEDEHPTEEVLPQAPPPPLFTRQTMRPDTPPLLLKAMNDPTDANLDAYLDWQHQYLSRTLEVEAKLKQRRQQRNR